MNSFLRLKDSKLLLAACCLALLSSSCVFRASKNSSPNSLAIATHSSSTTLQQFATESALNRLIINNTNNPNVLLIFLLIALATLVTEDLTCVWTGALIAEGRMTFGLGVIACLVGIFIGDLLLFLAGRFLGRPALSRAPLKWFVRETDVDRGSAWFRRKGMTTIFISRFIPGTRLPTYIAAGLLDTSIWKFSLYFLLAATAWTPLLVVASMLVGRELIESALIAQESYLLRAAIVGVILFALVRLGLRLVTFRGRRLLIGSWRRLARWEFWPLWFFYPPVVLYILYLGIKFKSLTLFTCVNPAIEDSGFVGESKFAILAGLRRNSNEFIPLTGLLQGDGASPFDQAKQFLRVNSLEYPIVLKPNCGERGSGVSIIRTDSELSDYLGATHNNVIIQQYAPGHEFGVFYYRYPNESTGNIFSITRKVFPTVIGDGSSNLETLILKDKRAVCMAHAYFGAQQDELQNIPSAGESVQLIEIGTHCRGSIFLEGGDIKTPALEAAIDRISQGFNGFYFGRFDIRTPSIEDFQKGTNFKIVELNGVTSEATNIYDPKNGLFAAYRVLFQQWRLAFEIGAQNRQNGFEPTSLRLLLNLTCKIFPGDVKGLAQLSD